MSQLLRYSTDMYSFVYPSQQAHRPGCPVGAAQWEALKANKEGEGGEAGGEARDPLHQLKQPDQVSTLKVQCSVCTDCTCTPERVW